MASSETRPRFAALTPLRDQRAMRAGIRFVIIVNPPAPRIDDLQPELKTWLVERLRSCGVFRRLPAPRTQFRPRNRDADICRWARWLCN
jgi:hypothetical protein